MSRLTNSTIIIIPIVPIILGSLTNQQVAKIAARVDPWPTDPFLAYSVYQSVETELAYAEKAKIS